MASLSRLPVGNRSKQQPSRYLSVDVLRGVAIVLMLAFHLNFDLVYFGVIRFDIYRDPLWVAARAGIVALFLLAMGISLVLATAGGVRWPRLWRRFAIIGAGALAASAGSYAIFPRSWIFFGVLHFIALASLLGLGFRRLYWTNLLLGAGLVGIGLGCAHPFFDQSLWRWVGLVTHKPITEDYVPLLPWFGVVLLGMWLGRAVFERGLAPWLAAWKSDHPVARLLALGGRHSLLIYLAHQPIFFGVFWLAL